MTKQTRLSEQEFKHRIWNQEIRVRGLYLMMAVDSDWMLGGIMVTLLVGKPESDLREFFKRNEISKKKLRLLHNLTLDEKLKLVKECMKEYTPELWKKHQKDLDEVDKLRGLRNDMAHGKIIWDEVNQNLDTLAIMTMTAEGEVKIEYDYKTLWNDISNYLTNFKSLLETINYELIPQDLSKK